MTSLNEYLVEAGLHGVVGVRHRSPGPRLRLELVRSTPRHPARRPLAGESPAGHSLGTTS